MASFWALWGQELAGQGCCREMWTALAEAGSNPFHRLGFSRIEPPVESVLALVLLRR